MSNIILTTYFTSKLDPQHNIRQPRNNFEKIKIWYNSLHKIGLRGVIFYDEMNTEFIEKYSTTNLTFERYTLVTPRSVNDERFYCYYNWIQNHKEIENICMVDLFDVEFFNNPFLIMNSEKYDIYCGGDPGVYHTNWLTSRMERAYKHAFYSDKVELHAVTLCGSRNQILKLLVKMIEEFENLSRRHNYENLNMPVYNKTVRDTFEEVRIMYGYPFNSRFRKMERGTHFAIRHK